MRLSQDRHDAGAALAERLIQHAGRLSLQANCFQPITEDIMYDTYDHPQLAGYDRVRAHTSKRSAAKQDQKKKANLERAAKESSFAAQRLGELEREWDIDRAVLLAFAGMGSVALLLGLRKNWRWRFPLSAQIASLLLHSIVGWSPQAAVLRRLGVRTRQEIESERYALQSMANAGLTTSNARA